MRHFLLLVLGLGLSTNAWAQATQVWQRPFGLATSTYIGCREMKRSSNGNIIAVGGTQIYSSVPVGPFGLVHGNFWRFNAQGDTLSTRKHRFTTYGYYANLLPLRGGDFLVTGVNDTLSIPQQFKANFLWVRTDSLGNWRTRPHYLPLYDAGGASQLVPLPGGSALWAQTVRVINSPTNGRSGAQVVRLDSAQRIVWQRQYTGNTPNSDGLEMQAAASLLDGSYVLVGTKSRPFTPGPGFLVGSGWMQRFKANGDTVRLPEYFGNLSELYEPQDVQPTADGGFVVTGSISPDKYVPVFNCCPIPKGWVAKFDSLGTMQWEKRLPGLDANTPQGGWARVVRAFPLANGQVVVAGLRAQTNSVNGISYLAAYAPTGATPVWETTWPAETMFNWSLPTATTSLSATGELVVNGVTPFMTNDTGFLTKFANLGTPAVIDYCRRPPRPNAGYALGATGDSLTLADFSEGGPRFALVERWRWHLPGGVFWDGPTPPPQHYPTLPAPGTPVTLTVTNNLGCSATQTLYPWGAPNATQQAQQLARRASLFPNPATDAATLTLAGLAAGATATVQLRDALGRAVGMPQAVRAGAEGSARLELPVAGLPAGVYTVLVQTPQATFAKKLVRQ